MLIMLLCAIPAVFIRYVILKRPVSWPIAFGISLPILIVLIAIMPRRANGQVSAMPSGGIAIGLICLTSGYSRRREDKGIGSGKTTSSRVVDKPIQTPPAESQLASKPVKRKTFEVDNSRQEEELYAQAAAELNGNDRDKGLWARCFAECDGDENKAKVLYLKTRVRRLEAARRGT